MELIHTPGQTPLDPDEAAGLKPRHINTQAQLNEWEQNILKGLRWGVKQKAALLDDGFVNEAYPLDELVVRFHHALVCVHPFPNGNGRHSRMMADLLIARRGGDRFTWGAHVNLGAAGQVRNAYIAALKAADEGRFDALVNFARS